MSVHRPTYDYDFDILGDTQKKAQKDQEFLDKTTQAATTLAPESEPDRNLRLIQEYQRRGRPLPTVSGTNLKDANDQLQYKLDTIPDSYFTTQYGAEDQQYGLKGSVLAEGAIETAALFADPVGGLVTIGSGVAAGAAGAENETVEKVMLAGGFVGFGGTVVRKGGQTIVKGVKGALLDEDVVLSGDKTLDKLILALSQAKDNRNVAQALRSKEMQKRVAAMQKIRDEADLMGDDELYNDTSLRLRQLDDMWRNAASALKGKLPDRALIISDDLKMTPQEVLELRTKIVKNKNFTILEQNRADWALQDLFTGGMPQKGDIELLSDMFGVDLGRVFKRYRGTKQKVYDATLDVLNAPMSTLSSFDLSAPFRQGYFLTVRAPARSIPAMGSMFKAFASQKYADELLQNIVEHPNYRLLKRNGLQLTGVIGKQEESFISTLPQRIPIFGQIVKASDRAYKVFLNKIRFEYTNGIYESWLQGSTKMKFFKFAPRTQKEIVDSGDLQLLTRMVNHATGRGPMLGTAEMQRVFSPVFYAPRLATSRFALPASTAHALFKGSPAMRYEAATMLATGFGAMGGMLGLAKMMGVEVETDPRSTDFLKMKIGKTRIDLAAGYSQVFRVMAQLATGQSKSTGTGTVTDKSTTETVGRFLRSKFSPAAGLVTDVATGETFIGEEVSLTSGAGVLPPALTGDKEADLAENITNNALWERLTPLFIQDLTEAMEQEGILRGGLLAAPGIFGASITSFTTSRDVVNHHLKENIEVTDDNGDRIFDLQDERMTPVQKAQLFADNRVRRDLDDLNRTSTTDALYNISENRRIQRAANDMRFTKGQTSAKDWKQRRTTINLQKNAMTQVKAIFTGQIDNTKRFSGPVGFLLELIGKNEADRTAEEQALLKYYDITQQYIDNPTVLDNDLDLELASDEELERIAAGIDIEGLTEARDQFLSELSPKELEYVIDNTHPDRSPIEDQYLRAQTVLKEYWNAPETVANGNEKILSLYNQWKDKPQNEQRAFALRNPSVKRMEARVQALRTKIRQRNRQVDDLLITYYDLVPQHRANVAQSRGGLATERIKQRIFGLAAEELDKSINIAR